MMAMSGTSAQMSGLWASAPAEFEATEPVGSCSELVCAAAAASEQPSTSTFNLILLSIVNFNLFWRLVRPHQPEEHCSIRRIERHRYLVGLHRGGHVDPVGAEAAGEAVGLRLQLPAGVIRRPGNLQLFGGVGCIHGDRKGRCRTRTHLR